jgi:hypothetical protein
MNDTGTLERGTACTLSPEDRRRLEAVATVDPDTLLAPAGRSIIGRTVLVSVVCHAAIIGLTSFALFADWGEYGVHTPNTIKRLKREQAEEARRREREAADAKAARERVAAEAAGTPDRDGSATDKPPAEAPKPKEVDPLNPLESFELDERDLGL